MRFRQFIHDFAPIRVGSIHIKRLQPYRLILAFLVLSTCFIQGVAQAQVPEEIAGQHRFKWAYRAVFGQSFITRPGTPYNNVHFEVSGQGGVTFLPNSGFLLSQEYLGKPADLNSSIPGFLGQSIAVVNLPGSGTTATRSFKFDPSITLDPNTKYFFYTNQRVQFAVSDIGYFPPFYYGGPAYDGDYYGLDGGGNFSATYRQNYRYDVWFRVMASPASANQPPTVSCPEPVECQCNEPSSREVTLTAEIADPDGDALDVKWFVDGDLVQEDIGSLAATSSLTHTYGLGASEVTITVSDGTAPPVICSTIVTVVDTEDPVAICGPDLEVETDLGECFASNVVLEAPSVSDNCEVASIENDAPAVFPHGLTTVTWTITDVGGNSVTCEQLVTVVDNEKPRFIDSPQPITVPHDFGQCDAVVELVEPATSDNCGVASVTSTAPENNAFPVGETLVVWTVTDLSGNEEIVLQTVTVTNSDPIADVRVTGADIADEFNRVFIECDGANGTTVALDASASMDPDEGDVLTYAWATAEGTSVMFSDSGATPTATFPMGATTVTLVVSDQCGAVSSTDVIVVIEDTTAPQIEIAYTDKQVLWPPNHKMVPVAISVAVRDTCSNPERLIVACAASSNQMDDSEGDGSTIGDVDGLDGFVGDVPVTMTWNEVSGLWEGVLELRAERDGGNVDRKYSFSCVVADESSNVTTATFCVVVPHDKRKNQ